jgi:hypothetical protein
VKVAALYVATNGCYFGLDDVEPWDAARDARLYEGPHPVVAHPPCERWGRYWYGGPMLHAQGRRKQKGDDDGCFAHALRAVKAYGGVLEHPAATHAWRAFNIVAPPSEGGWVPAGIFHPGAFTCHVEQGHYGHRARKATWLFAVASNLPTLTWGPSNTDGFVSGRHRHVRIDPGFHSKEERAAAMERRRAACEREGIPWETVRRPPPGLPQEQRDARRRVLAEIGWCTPERMSKTERAATPIPFRDLLLEIARGAA